MSDEKKYPYHYHVNGVVKSEGHHYPITGMINVDEPLRIDNYEAFKGEVLRMLEHFEVDKEKVDEVILRNVTLVSGPNT